MTTVHPVAYLLKWIKTFEVAAAVESVRDISDGVILTQILRTIAPKHFANLAGNISRGTSLHWESKVANLKDIIVAIQDFVLQFSDETILVHPDLDPVRIAQFNDEDSAFRLLQLIIVCAVNCESKETYVEAIMQMEESVQHALMGAIQEDYASTFKLMNTRLSSHEHPEQTNGDQLFAAGDEWKNLVYENMTLSEKCRELELKLSTVLDEKSSLATELKRLRSSVGPDYVVSNEGTFIDSSAAADSPIRPTGAIISPTLAGVRISQLQNQVTKLREELYNSEAAKEVLDIKLKEYMKNATELKQKCELLGQRAEESSHLKDELDIVREELASVSHLPVAVDQLRKRADEALELRARCSKLEAENVFCVQRIAELEKESRINSNLRSQMEAERLEASDARMETVDAVQRAEIAEVELSRVRRELLSTIREKERIIAELNRLQSCCEQLQLSVVPSNTNDVLPASPTNNVQLSLSIQSQFHNLQEELTRLRSSLSLTDPVTSSSLIGKYEDSATEVGADLNGGPLERLSSTLSKSELQNSSKESLTNGVEQHSCSDYQKEKEISHVEQKYRIYLWKARDIIRFQQRKLRQHEMKSSKVDESQSSCSGTIDRLRALVVEKEQVIEKLETHLEQNRLIREAEERILVSAWYNLGMNNARQCVERNLRQNSAGCDDQYTARSRDLSFLNKQRELHLKVPRDVSIPGNRFDS